MSQRSFDNEVTGIFFKPDPNSSAIELGIRKNCRGLEVVVCVRSFDDEGGYLDEAKNRADYDFIDVHFTKLKGYLEEALANVHISPIDIRTPSRNAFIWRFEPGKKKEVYNVAKDLEKKYSKKD